MIQQQYYTREKRGIFRPSEGYDTIAKSKDLNENFIKKYLHPFCFYDAPKSLESFGEKDSFKYPEAFTCFQVESGEMVLGRSVYVSADFTGLRSTFFTHNFIIPKDEKLEYIKNANMMLFAKGFVRDYDIENGKEIPELSSLDFDIFESPTGSDVLKDMGITSQIYKKLLYAVIMSSCSNKKVYINLGVAISSISNYAKILLKYILNGLPYYVRENIGYITYLKEPESRKYINIMFIDDEGLKTGYSKVEREYIFDLTHGRILNADIDVESHPYLNFAWDSIDNPPRLESFYRFCCSILNSTKPELKLSIQVYDELSVLYQIEEGNIPLYQCDREHILQSVRKYYDYCDEGGKDRLNEIYLRIIDRELEDISSGRYISSYEIIRCIVDYFNMGVQKVNGRIFYLIQSLLYR